MTNILETIYADAKALVAKIEGSQIAQEAEKDVEAAGSATLNFIKTNGLQDLYQIALAVVSAMAGAPWAATLASIETQAVTDGKQLIAGATATVASLAQADLIAAGKMIAPTSSALVVGTAPATTDSASSK